MAKYVEIEDTGLLVEFPDEASDDQIRQAMLANLDRFREDLGQGRLSSAKQSFLRTNAEQTGNILQGVARFLERAAPGAMVAPGVPPSPQVRELVGREQEMTPVEREARLRESPLYKLGTSIVEGGQEAFRPNPKYSQEFWTGKVASGAGSLPSVIALGAMGGPALGGLGYGSAMGEQQAQDAIEFGAIDQADKAFLLGMGIGGISEFALGVPSRLFGWVRAARKAGLNPAEAGQVATKGWKAWSAANPFKARSVEGAVREGFQESLEQLGQNVTAKDILAYDPERPRTQGVLESGMVGATLGGIVGGGAGAITKPQRPTVTEPGQEQDAQASDIDFGQIEKDLQAQAQQSAVTPAAAVPPTPSQQDVQDMAAGTLIPVQTPLVTDAQRAAAPATAATVEKILSGEDAKDIENAIQGGQLKPQTQPEPPSEPAPPPAPTEPNIPPPAGGQTTEEVIPNEEGMQEGQGGQEVAPAESAPPEPTGGAPSPNVVPIEDLDAVDEAADRQTTEPSQEPQPATAATVPAETPPAAVAKAQEAVTEASDTEGQRSAKDIKDELVQRLETAIAEAPSKRDTEPTYYTRVGGRRVKVPPAVEPSKVTISIPGDGVFTVVNTKENLTELLKRAKKMSVASTDTKARIPRGAIKSSEGAIEKTWVQRPEPGITEDEFEKAHSGGQQMASRNVEMAGNAILVSASDAAKPIWGAKRFLSYLVGGKKSKRGAQYFGKVEPSKVRELFRWLQEKGEQFKIKTAGTLQAFGVVPMLWNAALDVAITTFKAGEAVVTAVDAAVAFVNDHYNQGWDEAGAREDIQKRLETLEAEEAPSEIEYPVGPGQRKQPSKGRFVGPVTKDDVETWRNESAKFVDQFGTNLDEALIAAIAQDAPVGPDFRQWILSEIISRAEGQLQAAASPVEQLRLRNFMSRVAAILRDSGTQEFGKVGAARHHAFKAMEWLMPVLAYRGLVNDAHERLKGIYPEVTHDKIKAWLAEAGRQAIKEVGAVMSKSRNVSDRILKLAGRAAEVNWGDLFTSSWANQREFQMELYRRIRLHPKLADLTPSEAQELTKILDAAWQRKRMEIFRREFRKKVPMPNIKEKDRKKIENALPEIVKQANLGLLQHEAFLNAIAPEYGVAKIDGPTARKIEQLAQKAQAFPVGSVMRRRTLTEIVETIKRDGGVKAVDVFKDYWYAAMLSGIRTQVDNALNILNGALNTAMMVARNPGASPLILPAWFRGLASAAKDVPGILFRGERWRLVASDVQHPVGALEVLADSPNPLARLLSNAKYVGRVMNALDHLTSLSTRQAATAWALYRDLGSEKAAGILNVSDTDIANAEAQARLEGASEAEVSTRAREILEKQVPSEIIIRSTELGKLVAFQTRPYGLAGHVYDLIQSADQNIPYFKLLSGTMFARFALNYSNEILNYIPPIGLIRWGLSSPGMAGHKFALDVNQEVRELFLVKSVFGTLLASLGAAIFLAKRDDEDKEEPFFDITGSFKSVDNGKRYQLLNEGKQPYSIRIGNWHFSYRQLAVAGILGVLGELRDQQMYSPKTWDEDNAIRLLGNAAASGLFIVRDSSALTGFADMLGLAQSYRYNTNEVLEKTAPRFFARLMGGLMPNLAKELDAWTDPQYYQANTGYEYFLREVPVARRMIGGGPMVNVLGEPVRVERYPWSRWIKHRKQDPVWDALAEKANMGVFIPTPSKSATVLENGKRREMTPAEFYDYQVTVGKLYKEKLTRDLPRFRAMNREQALRYLNQFDRLRLTARMRVAARSRAAAASEADAEE